MTRQIKYNISPRKSRIEYIVIHDTGNKGNGANAESHFNYFNGGDRQSSADFFVDDKQILKVNDYNVNYTWHCGDGKGKYGITNGNSVGIEICVNSDGDYSKAFANAVQLTKQLMAELNISIDRVVRHYDASRKNCPASMSANNWELWRKFKENITDTEDEDMARIDELEERLSAIEDKVKPKYAYIDMNMPEWAHEPVEKAIIQGKIKLNNGKIDPALSDNDLRLITIMMR